MDGVNYDDVLPEYGGELPHHRNPRPTLPDRNAATMLAG